MKSSFLPKCLALAGVIAASAAQAVTLLPSDIDFRTPAWSVVDGQTSPQTVDNVTVVASVVFGFNNGVLTQNAATGIGIQGTIFNESDEIGILELFSVVFNGSSGIGLTGVWITNLFNESIPAAFPFAELGFYSFDLTTWVPFSGIVPEQSNGELYVPFGAAIDVSAIHFSVAPDDFISDFSVAGFTKNHAGQTGGSVPDSGSTMMLLGGTLLGLGGVCRFICAKD